MPGRPTRVLVIRHGQSVWNAEGRWQGHADPPLSALGIEQAMAASRAVGAVDAIVASDLGRARHTAELIAEAAGVGPVRLEPRLRETDAGEWTGLTRDDIERQYPGWLAEHRRPARFERWEHVAGRAAAALSELAGEWPGGEVLAVAHGGVIRALERSLDVLGALVPNLSGRWFAVDGASIQPGERVLLLDPHESTVTTPHQL
jgi:broad specificity phosphatase PhoE